MKSILAIEWMTAAQELGFRKNKSSKAVETMLAAYREIVPELKEDRVLYIDIQATRSFLTNYKL